MAFRLIEDGVILVQYMYPRRAHLERHGETRLSPNHTASQRREAPALPMTMGERYSEDKYDPPQHLVVSKAPMPTKVLFP